MSGLQKGDLVYVTPWFDDTRLAIIKVATTSCVYEVIHLDQRTQNAPTYHINALVPIDSWPPPWMRPLTPS
jgi:hypothetical protein